MRWARELRGIKYNFFSVASLNALRIIILETSTTLDCCNGKKNIIQNEINNKRTRFRVVNTHKRNNDKKKERIKTDNLNKMVLYVLSWVGSHRRHVVTQRVSHTETAGQSEWKTKQKIKNNKQKQTKMMRQCDARHLFYLFLLYFVFFFFFVIVECESTSTYAKNSIQMQSMYTFR